MRLHIINTGSSGNCYVLEGKEEALIIEAGSPFVDVKKALNFDISKIKGLIVTHEHGDHFKHFSEFWKAGVPCYASKGTLKKGYSNYWLTNSIENKKLFNIGGFSILPFDVQHDAEEPLGFLINHSESGNILFATDTYYLKYKFDNLNHVILEANYDEDIIDRKMKFGGGNKFVRDRVIKSHMSLQQCLETLKANDLTAVTNIVLIHLSDTNSNERMFKDRVQSETGKRVTIASPGISINFSKNVF